MKEFIEPDFSKRSIELRFEDDTVCIYGTKEGLQKIANLCKELVDHPAQGHIHLENYSILTRKSKKGAIAIFKK